MKKYILLALLFIGGANSSMAQSKTKAKPASLKKETFEVNGNCGMCRNTIEKTAKKAGAEYASWNMETHQLTVKYNPKKITVPAMQQQIAAVGYDNAGATAPDQAYEKLHSCCKYERKPDMTPVEAPKQ